MADDASDDDAPGPVAVVDSLRGQHPDGARDISDELLLPGEQISNAERSVIRRERDAKIMWPAPSKQARR